MLTTTKYIAASALFLCLNLIASEKCKAWDTTDPQGKYNFSKYWVQNNIYGINSAGSEAWQYLYWGSYDGVNANIGYEWNYPISGVGVVAYPYIGTIASPLPSKISANKNINVEWGFTTSPASGHTSVTGHWDNSLDMWIMGDSHFNSPAKAEVMIWLGAADYVNPSGSYQYTASINGSSWDVWKGTESSNGQTWDYYCFKIVGPNTNYININVRWFLNTLVNNKWLNAKYYLTQLQAGSELFDGYGALNTYRYKVY